MEYRKLGRTGLYVSEVGMGGEWLAGLPTNEVIQVFDRAIEAGVNIIDIFMPQPEIRENIGRALFNRRDKMIIQGHFRTVCENGQYVRTNDLSKVKASFEALLAHLDTDYIDIGMIHYIDSYEDLENVLNGELMIYVQGMKKCGKIRHIGMSSHNANVALKAIETGIFDVLMFSINPAYDMEDGEAKILDMMEFKGIKDGSAGLNGSRAELYAACERLDVGITVMKGLGAGTLLNAETSPFGASMSVSQCIHYCLTRPAVSSVLIGYHSLMELEEALKYINATPEERDYTQVLLNSKKFDLKGRCMYCNHCQPCSAEIDIAAVTKYLHLAQMQSESPETVIAHYNALENKASACIECGQCEPNCPFDVKIIENMQAAAELFGE